MSHLNASPQSKSGPIGWRPKQLSQRFRDLQAVTKRTAASLIHEAVEANLPKLEKQFRAELQQLKKSRPTA